MALRILHEIDLKLDHVFRQVLHVLDQCLERRIADLLGRHQPDRLGGIRSDLRDMLPSNALDAQHPGDLQMILQQSHLAHNDVRVQEGIGHRQHRALGRAQLQVAVCFLFIGGDMMASFVACWVRGHHRRHVHLGRTSAVDQKDKEDDAQDADRNMTWLNLHS